MGASTRDCEKCMAGYDAGHFMGGVFFAFFLWYNGADKMEFFNRQCFHWVETRNPKHLTENGKS